ncbi:universal stress protein [Pseudohoeflea coraliihabitans]|uniref:Universal stress protein n=1 Tax=Pseudohoeflea coraliihabitans TaxID=2860393 RepID=A0ABS6WUV4_9HYPH|nr:universal stress protein [Pseudohoeflea sp. DP4N28-3]MBW3098820.1 universal stress protein [Pseudohoeflea sp. DP4N28-3]
MSFKTILAVFACPADVEPVVAAAAQTPAGAAMHLIGSHGEPSQFVILSAPVDVPDVATLSALYQQSDDRMAAVEAEFRAVCERGGISHEWRAVRTAGGDSATSALGSARIADLVVARQARDESGDRPDINFHTLLFEGGAPVLVLGEDGRFAAPLRRVLIAWDGSREAARAVKDALPFLTAAEEVIVLIVDAERLADIDRPTPGADLAASLARHGVNVQIETVGRGERGVSQVISDRVKAHGVDLLVMGAYAHPRLRDWLFGGVTHSVMDAVPVATLLSR